MIKCADNYRIIHPAVPEADLIEDACRIMAGGGVVAFPASAIYGLAADAYNPVAVEKIREMKNRPTDNPILLLVKDRRVVDELAATVPAAALPIMERFWPGGVTLVFAAASILPEYLISETGMIGIRVPNHPVAQALTARYPSPITGTSTNISGQEPFDEATRLNETLALRPDLVLDAGKLKGGVGSTVVDVTASPPVILREGIVPASLIFETLADLKR